ncbi:hypothetical protein R1flu_009949 [Riccia fluitans]|uniref:Uncharacterized protein n=1 Tax=Riccia fluitans TaxID=41844 RepID=A0ABD1Z7U0_9MARC
MGEEEHPQGGRPGADTMRKEKQTRVSEPKAPQKATQHIGNLNERESGQRRSAERNTGKLVCTSLGRQNLLVDADGFTSVTSKSGRLSPTGLWRTPLKEAHRQMGHTVLIKNLFEKLLSVTEEKRKKWYMKGN